MCILEEILLHAKVDKEKLTIFCDAIKFLINKYFLTNIIEKEDIILSVNKNLEIKDQMLRHLNN